MNFTERIKRFFRGRYGADNLCRFMLVLMLIFTLLYVITRVYLFDLISFILVILILFRMMSRNYEKRSAENRKYLELTENVRVWIKNIRSDSSSTHKVFMCPQCRQKVRVPKGKGKIQITCPKCHHVFIKRS